MVTIVITKFFELVVGLVSFFSRLAHDRGNSSDTNIQQFSLDKEGTL